MDTFDTADFMNLHNIAMNKRCGCTGLLGKTINCIRMH